MEVDPQASLESQVGWVDQGTRVTIFLFYKYVKMTFFWFKVF